MELNKTYLVKHSIKLNDYTPFKERYQRIVPHQYDEVRKHLQEMLDIGAKGKSCSPWASVGVLVRKKDCSLRFHIDLHKHNAKTIKDPYSLPRIEESLNCLYRACVFTSLHLKSGYWQVMLDMESMSLTAFKVGPLGFYKCVCIPFGFTNALSHFKGWWSPVWGTSTCYGISSI